LAAARFLDVRAGDVAQLTFHIGSDRKIGRFKVVAICETLAGFDNFRSRVANAIGSGMLMPMRSFRKLTGDAPDDARLVRYFLKVNGDETAQKAAATEIRDKFDLRFRFGVKSAAEQKREAQVV